MRRSLAVFAALAFVAISPPAIAGLECLNSKPCGTVCIADNKVCHLPPHCRRGYFRCGKSCIPDRDLCAVRLKG
jgi:hypothetical protein